MPKGTGSEQGGLPGLTRTVDILVDTDGDKFEELRLFDWVLNPAWFQKEPSLYGYEREIITKAVKDQAKNPDSDLAKALFAQIEGEKEDEELRKREENEERLDYEDYIRQINSIASQL